MLTHEDIKELSDKFKGHQETLEERLVQDPADDGLRDALDEAENAVEQLDTLLAVDDEELEKLEDTVAELVEKERVIAERLEK